MSFFGGITKAVHSTVAWLEKEMTIFEREAPTIERVIDASLTYIGPALQIGLDAIGQTEAATLSGVVIKKAQSDLQVASALVYDFGPTPTAATIFSSVETNLGALLAAGQIKNATTVATVTKAVNEVGVLASAVQTAATAIGSAAKPTA